MSFESLKKDRKKFTNSLKEKLEAENVGYDDPRFWKLSRDKTGTGWATIRFLPEKDNGVPYVKVFSHSFKGPTGKHYIENSLTTLDKKDPVKLAA